MRLFTWNPRRMGKRLQAEEQAKRDGAWICKPDGIFRWTGKHWEKVEEMPIG